MKRSRNRFVSNFMLLVLIVFSACAFVACGKDKKNTTKGDISNTQAATTSPTTTPTAVTTPDTTPDVTPTVDSTPTPTPVSHEGMVRSSLTNEWISEEIANQRPIAVMMNNLGGPNPKNSGTPQSGISAAGVVYECKVEGNITRLLSIIEDWEDLPKIGSVRSVRKYYVFWALEWDSILMHYGGPVIYVQDTLNRKDVDNLDGQVLEGKAYYRISERVAPHNAYGSGEGVLKGLEIKKYSRTHTDRYAGPDHFKFASDDAPTVLSSGIDARIVRPGYEENKPWFEYNADEDLYYRYQYGKEQIDDTNNEHLSCKNIIIQFAQSSSYEDGYKQFTTNDSGKGGYFITGGKAVPITWKKESDYAPTKFYYENGEEIQLNTGKTWICVVRLQDKNSVKIEK